MHLLQLLSCLALVVGALTQIHTVSSESGRLLCTDKDRISDIVREYGMEKQDALFDDVVVNCCVEEPDTSLRKATVSAFVAESSSNPTSVRFQFVYVSGTVVVRKLASAALNYTWNGTHCYECNASASMGGALCSECHEYCVSCNGSDNSARDCQRCKFATNESAAMDNYCLSHCEHGFKGEGCTECPGYREVIGVVETEAAEGSHAGETNEEGEGVGCSQFEYECLPSDQGCPVGQSMRSLSNCPRSVCFGGGIPYCNVSENTKDCSQCYPPFEVMVPLHFQEEIREEAEEKVEEIGGHFKKNCFEHKVCLTESQREECIEEFLRIQSEILREEIAEEERSRETKDLALKTALPIVCGLVIIVFVSLSVFAHYRYPHVSPSGEKRHRKKKEEDENVAAGSQTWRPRPTIRYR